MHELVAFCEKYKPGIAHTFEPASEDDIELVESVTGPLPGAFLRFARTMGASTGDLLLDGGAARLADITTIWSVCDTLSWLRSERFKRFQYIGQDNSPNNGDYFLDRQSPHGTDDCMLVQMPLVKAFNPDDRSRVHAGLEEFLYYQAFRGLRLPQFQNHRKIIHQRGSTARSKPEQMYTLAKTMGFTRISPMTHSAVFERDGAGLLVYRAPLSDAFSFILGCDDMAGCEKLSADFTRQLGMAEDPMFTMEYETD